MRQRRKRPQRRLRPELVGQVRLALQVLPLGRGGPPRPRLRRCRRRDRPLLRRSRDRRALSRRRLAVGGIQRAAGRLLECVGGYAGTSSAAPVRALGTGDGQAPLRHRPSHRRRLRADRRQRAAGPAGARAAPRGALQRCANLRTDAVDPARPQPAAARGHPARHADRRQGGHRHERLGDHVPGAAADHRRDLERHRRDPADARAPRRLRLERRHVHLGFPDPGELLPPDRGWARRLRHRRRAALLRQQGR